MIIGPYESPAPSPSRRRRGSVASTLALSLSLSIGSSALLASCAAPDEVDSSEDSASLGSLAFELEAAPGITLATVGYTISGNGFTKTGEIDVSASPLIQGLIGGIPAGQGFTITLSATSTDGGTTCAGSATFDAAAGATTAVTVHLRCSGAPRTGSVTVNGSLNLCPLIDELTVLPLTANVGGSIRLVAAASDADDAPASLTHTWSTSGGTLSGGTTPEAVLTSSKAGSYTVTLVVSDGDCTDSASATVTFVAPPLPNILLIIADDLGAEASSLYPHLNGSSGAVPAPNLEALAAQGLVFENAWASPMCSPTRATIVSGSYGHRTGVTTAGDVLPTSTVSVFDRITAESPANYSQALFGKYHLAGNSSTNLQHVRDLGLSVFRGYMGHSINNPYTWTAVDLNGPSVAFNTFATTVLTDFAVDFFRNHETTRANDPWFVIQSHSGVHEFSNYVPPPELHSVDLGGLQPGQLSNTVLNYKALIQSLDTEIGRALAEVDLEKTTVIFIGDNGTIPSVKDSGSGVRDSKRSVYEGGIRVPLIIAGAGVTRRGRENALVTSTDLYATILSLAGLPVSHVNNSYSLKPLLTDADATSGRTHSFTELCSGTNTRRYAIRDLQYKLLVDGNQRGLYDLVADPLEANNLYLSEAHAEIRAGLEAEIAELKAEATAGCFL